MRNIENYRKNISITKTIEELMGVEGNIRQEYYKSWNVIIDQNVEFNKRVYHPADNMINSLISFVNTLVYTKTLSEIYKTQLNPTISFLHQPGTRRFSLALDVSEVFKPLIADRLIFSLLNRKQITEDSFVKDLNGLQLTEKASKTIMAELDNKLKTTIFHKELNKNVSYQFLIRLELYKLIKHIIGEKEYKGFEMWWYYLYVILVYDILFDDKGKKILPKVFKVCKKYLTHIQNSVFEGNLSKANSIAMKNELAQYVRKDKDSVIMFHTREERWLSKDFLGIEEDKTSNFL